jgi:hypothetical protein
VHALVRGLVDQFPDPTSIVVHPAQGSQMLQRGAHHSWHGGDRFEHDGAVSVTPCKEGVGCPSKDLRGRQGNDIGRIPCFPMLVQFRGSRHACSPSLKMSME